MARTYRYAILQLLPFAHRDEVINVGIVVFRQEKLQVRLSAPPTLLSYFGVQSSTLDWVAESVARRDNPERSLSERVSELSSLSGVKLSELGWFSADEGEQYELRLNQIIGQYVDKPKVAKPRLAKKRLLDDLKRVFKEYEIYGQRPEDLHRHRVVARMPVGPSGKLHIDFLLKNGTYHATETLDFRTSQDAGPNELKNAALASVTFQHARDALGPNDTNCYLVYAASSIVEAAVRPAIEIAGRDVTDSFNIESREDKVRYVDVMLAAAGVNHMFQ